MRRDGDGETEIEIAACVVLVFAFSRTPRFGTVGAGWLL